MPDATDWRSLGYRYYSRNFFNRKHFGCRVWKVSLDGHFSCPNRDGTLGTAGCIFCNPESFSPSRRQSSRHTPCAGLVDQASSAPSPAHRPCRPTLRVGARGARCRLQRAESSSVTAQLDEGIRRLQARHKAECFIAYFQPATNTYVGQDSILPSPQPTPRSPLCSPAALAHLRSLYEEALAHPAVVGLAIGTRPDCVPDPILDLLAELNVSFRSAKARYFRGVNGDTGLVSLEYGLQTIHDRSLDWLNRGHHYDAFLGAAARSRQRGLALGVHVILGIPGESREDMQATARELARLQVDSVKLHNLYAVRGTRLGEMAAAGEVQLPGLEDYVTYVVDFLERLPGTCVIDRLSGDAPPEYLIAPAWCLDKSAVRAAVEAEFTRRGSWQGGFLLRKTRQP